jgi:hypothetical protein
MSLGQLLSQERDSILRRWLELVAESHPTGTSPLVRGKDQFTNPEAHIISRDTEALYGELLQNRLSSETVSSSLNNILRLRAVQDLTPSQAVSFVFLLKEAIADRLGGEIEKRQLLGQWLEFESKIDKLASLAFDTYMQCRETICQLRVNEVKAQKESALRLLELSETAGRKRIGAAERPA